MCMQLLAKLQQAWWQFVRSWCHPYILLHLLLSSVIATTAVILTHHQNASYAACGSFVIQRILHQCIEVLIKVVYVFGLNKESFKLFEGYALTASKIAKVCSWDLQLQNARQIAVYWRIFTFSSLISFSFLRPGLLILCLRTITQLFLPLKWSNSL